MSVHDMTWLSSAYVWLLNIRVYLLCSITNNITMKSVCSRRPLPFGVHKILWLSPYIGNLTIPLRWGSKGGRGAWGQLSTLLIISKLSEVCVSNREILQCIIIFFKTTYTCSGMRVYEYASSFFLAKMADIKWNQCPSCSSSSIGSSIVIVIKTFLSIQ